MKKKIRNLLIFCCFASGIGWLLKKVQGINAVNYYRIVCFHSIPTYSLADFERYLNFFQKHYEVVSLNDVVSGSLDTNSKKMRLAITFDDGFFDFLTNAWPIIKKYKFPVTVFVCSKPLLHKETDGQEFAKRRIGIDAPLLSAVDIVDLTKEGVNFEYHTHSHQQLKGLDKEQLSEELVKFRGDLETKLSQKFNYLALPFGTVDDFDNPTLEFATKNAYEKVFSIVPGFNEVGTKNFLLNRDSLSLDFSNLMLWLWMKGYYDWPKKIQNAFKRHAKY